MRAVDYVDLGRYLRDVRESLHVTVEQAAVALHIRPRYLYDLESGSLDAIPGKAYLRGYIKNYAEFLQLDSREVLEEYEKLLGGSATPQYFVPQAGVHSNMPSRNILWLCTAGLAAVYGLWYFAIYDHTTVENIIQELPVDEAAGSDAKMDAGWQKCLDSSDEVCFFEQEETLVAVDMKPLLIPEMPPPETPSATTGSDDKNGDRNDDNE